MHHCKTLPIAIFSLILGGISLVPCSELHAGASNKNGNPFGNGTFFSNDGTFSAVLRGQNLVGITQFSTYGSGTVTSGIYPAQNTGGPGTYGTAANVPGTINIFYAGTTFPGVAGAVIDPASGVISSVFSMANAGGGGGGAYTANLQNSYPNQTFSGTGAFNPNGAGGAAANISFSVNGVRISSSGLVYQ